MKTNFLHSRCFRTLICFFCVLALVISLSPIKADALIIEGTLGGIVFVEALKVLSSVLVAVGVLSVAQELDWDNVLYNLESYMSDLGFIDDNGNMTVYQSEAGPYFVDESVIEATRDFIFDNSVVSSEYINPERGFAWDPSLTLSFGWARDVTCDSNVNLFICQGNNSNKYRLVFLGDHPFNAKSGSYKYSSTYSETHNLYYVDGTATLNYPPDETVDFLNNIYIWDYSPYGANSIGTLLNTLSSYFVSGSIGTTLALDVTGVADRKKELDEAYTTWVSVGIQMEDDGGDQDPIPAYPISLYGTIEEVKKQSQESTQSGVGSWQGPVIEPDVGTDTDVGVDQTWLGSKIDSLIFKLQSIFDSIIQLPSKFSTWFEKIIDWIDSLKLVEWFETIIEWIQGLKLKEWFDSLIEGILNLPTAIGEFILTGIREIFVPSEDFITTKVTSIRSEFAFADSIISSGEYIGEALQGMGSEPPVIYINLSNNRGPYNLGGEVAFLDLRWYEEYKPTVDLILSAFLWLLFAWRVYIKAPGIIRGLPGDYPAIRDMSNKD